MENTFFKVAEALDRNVLVICDRGTMDASAFITPEQWEKILKKNNWNDVELRDNRYNQVIHLVSAAVGAEKFYSLDEHVCRSEGIDLAQELDNRAGQAWLGHPYYDRIDNLSSADFESKLKRMIASVCVRLGIDAGDRLQSNSRKVKFLVKGPLPVDDDFPVEFRDFKVVHYFLRSSGTAQVRLRKRGHKRYWSYTHTIRRPVHGQWVEVKTTLSPRDYALMMTQADKNHYAVLKTRRCFIVNEQYFQMDFYVEPAHPRCKGLILMETFTTLPSEELYQRLPKFLTVVKEVTGDPRYSMFNLSLKESWDRNEHFYGNPFGSSKHLSNGVKNGDAPSIKMTNGKGDQENERNEKFLACCDEKSINYYIAHGWSGINNSMTNNGTTTTFSSGTGKFKGYENDHVHNGQ